MTNETFTEAQLLERISYYAELEIISTSPGTTWGDPGLTYHLNVNSKRKGGKRVLSNVTYSVGAGIMTEPITIVDVMFGYLMDAELGAYTFNEFCANLGYDTDSRSAMDMYMKCQDTLTALQAGFTSEELDTMQELLTDY